jgi:hypothetical protein
VSGRLDVSEFQARLGQRFRMALGAGHALDLELIDVRDLGRRRNPDGSELSCFALVFRAPTRGAAPQAIYRVEHEALGALEIFLVPIGPDAEGMRYEAVFN